MNSTKSNQSLEKLKEARTPWETVLTSTPVIMTVVATLLAGQSTSEMSRAQYYRSLASQSQSKVGDQWAFFQAKRIRGTTLDATADLFDALTNLDPVDPASMESAVNRLEQQLTQGAADAKRLAALLPPAAGSAAAPGGLEQAVRRLVETAEKSAAAAVQVKGRILATLRQPSTEQALTYLNAQQLPSFDKKAVDADPQVKQALDAIRRQAGDAVLTPLVLEITPAALKAAFQTAEDNGRGFDERCKPVEDALKALARLIDAALGPARAYLRAARTVSRAAAGQTDSRRNSAEMQSALARVAATAEEVKQSTIDWASDYKGARHRFNARRYERETQDHQDVAYLNEIQVHQHSAESDRHLLRSRRFFYGMLLAQMAVTISTLALAVRHKSVLWGLAAFAGLGALLYGVYVYLGMAP